MVTALRCRRPLRLTRPVKSISFHRFQVALLGARAAALLTERLSGRRLVGGRLSARALARWAFPDRPAATLRRLLLELCASRFPEGGGPHALFATLDADGSGMLSLDEANLRRWIAICGLIHSLRQHDECMLVCAKHERERTHETES